MPTCTSRDARFLHHARKRARMRYAAALELVVQVRMRVDVEHGEPRMRRTISPQDRVRHGMVAAEGKHAGVALQELGDGRFEFLECSLAAGDRDVADVGPPGRRAEIGPELGAQVRRAIVEHGADLGVRQRGPAHERRLLVPGQADNCHLSLGQRGHARSKRRRGHLRAV
jgi:hypothetical protein